MSSPPAFASPVPIVPGVVVFGPAVVPVVGVPEPVVVPQFVSRHPQVSGLLCGHVHWRYTVRIASVQPRLLCAGSATKQDVEGLWVFDVEAGHARATPGRWAGDGYVLESDAAVDVLG